MPAMLDDPTAPAIYRTSGEPPYPTPNSGLPAEITPRHLFLRDASHGTLVPFASASKVPARLLSRLAVMLNGEIEGGDTYPMINTMDDAKFGLYWFANFAAVMIQGKLEGSVEEIHQELAQMESDGADWGQLCLGTYYIKPNYPGRSSHVCNAGFLVSDVSRGKGVGRKMGETYLEFGPRLGYKYSIFNLVYETNTASLRIWDALGFQRVGRVKGAGSLKSYPDRLVDAIVYGRELSVLEKPIPQDSDADKSRKWWARLAFYLQTKTYPFAADAQEKSALRAAGVRCRWVPPSETEIMEGKQGKLMHNSSTGRVKEVVWEAEKQEEIVRNLHEVMHDNLNEMTKYIGERYHWERKKETVRKVIQSCQTCNENGGAKRKKQRRFPPDPKVLGLYPELNPHLASVGGIAEVKSSFPAPSSRKRKRVQQAPPATAPAPPAPAFNPHSRLALPGARPPPVAPAAKDTTREDAAQSNTPASVGRDGQEDHSGINDLDLLDMGLDLDLGLDINADSNIEMSMPTPQSMATPQSVAESEPSGMDLDDDLFGPDPVLGGGDDEEEEDDDGLAARMMMALEQDDDQEGDDGLAERMRLELEAGDG